MLRTTHWPVETPLHTDMTQLHHVEDDSLASGDPLHTDMTQLHHVEDDSLASGDSLHTDMTQLHHVEDDSLASGDPPEDYASTTALGRMWTGQLDSQSRPDCSCDQRTRRRESAPFTDGLNE